MDHRKSVAPAPDSPLRPLQLRRPRREPARSALYGRERERTWAATQVAQADILVRRDDCRTVELVVEVEFRKNKNGDLVAPRPKDLIGLLLAPAAADNHTPSNEYLNRYELRHAPTRSCRRGCRLRHESLHRRCGGTWQVARCRSADRESAWSQDGRCVMGLPRRIRRG
jgi:hypothetical protein